MGEWRYWRAVLLWPGCSWRDVCAVQVISGVCLAEMCFTHLSEYMLLGVVRSDTLSPPLRNGLLLFWRCCCSPIMPWTSPSLSLKP